MSTAVLDNPITNNAAVRQLREAQEAVEKIKNDAPQQFPEAASIGDAVRQGDIYIQLIDTVTKAPMLYRQSEPTFPMQLAEGNTKGSRHCLAHGNGVTVYSPLDAESDEVAVQIAAQFNIKPSMPDWRSDLRNAEWEDRRQNPTTDGVHMHISDAVALLQFAGPIFTLTEPNTVTHPEHGDWLLPPGSYRITYQRTVTRENVVARVLD
jgi:hypothetical protein